MPRRQVDITVFSPFQMPRRWLRRVALRALDVAFPGRGCQLGLAIADDEAVQRLNRQYRGLDVVTDVLAFSLGGQNNQEPFILPPQEPQPLGEVVISYPQAVRQAQVLGHPIEEELALLIVHGVLHLLGYGHGEPQEEGIMKAREQQALSRVF